MPPAAIRIGFILLTVFQGIGPLVYVLLWALVPQDDAAQRSRDELRLARWRGKPAQVERARRVLAGQVDLPRSLGPDGWTENLRLLVLGVALLAGSGILLAGSFSDQVSLQVAAPVGVVLVGAAIGLGQLDRTERERGLSRRSLGSWSSILRIAAGLLLVVTGVVLLVTPSLDPGALVTMAVAAVAVLLGVGVVLAPYARALLANLEAERGERVRQEERAEIAAHLHDSVLQTLALIQRRSQDPDAVAMLARSQERQLREYLYGAPTPPEQEDASLAVAVRRICAEVEDEHTVPVEVVTVGDTTISAGVSSLIQALREALLNAVRHGRVGVSVYVEAADDGVEAFVRDRGAGFDLDAVPEDRLGVRESVIGRMTRAGGRASVRKAPGGGTEVSLRLPMDTPREENT